MKKLFILFGVLILLFSSATVAQAQNAISNDHVNFELPKNTQDTFSKSITISRAEGWNWTATTASFVKLDKTSNTNDPETTEEEIEITIDPSNLPEQWQKHPHIPSVITVVFIDTEITIQTKYCIIEIYEEGIKNLYFDFYPEETESQSKTINILTPFELGWHAEIDYAVNKNTSLVTLDPTEVLPEDTNEDEAFAQATVTIDPAQLEIEHINIPIIVHYYYNEIDLSFEIYYSINIDKNKSGFSPNCGVQGQTVYPYIKIDNDDQEIEDTINFIEQNLTPPEGITIDNILPGPDNQLIFILSIDEAASIGETFFTFTNPDTQEEDSIPFHVLSKFTPDNLKQGEIGDLVYYFDGVINDNIEVITETLLGNTSFNYPGITVNSVKLEDQSPQTKITFSVTVDPNAIVDEYAVKNSILTGDSDVTIPLYVTEGDQSADDGIHPDPLIPEELNVTISPVAAPAGTEFTLKINDEGDFGAEQGASYVYFKDSSINVKVISWSETEIRAIVPQEEKGAYDVKVIKVPDASDLSTIQTSNTKNFSITALASAGQATIYPNPFNPNSETVKINYDHCRGSATNIGVYLYSASAKLVYNESTTASFIDWDGKDNGGNTVSDGVYLVRVVDENSRALLAKSKVLVVK